MFTFSSAQFYKKDQRAIMKNQHFTKKKQIANMLFKIPLTYVSLFTQITNSQIFFVNFGHGWGLRSVKIFPAFHKKNCREAIIRTHIIRGVRAKFFALCKQMRLECDKIPLWCAYKFKRLDQEQDWFKCPNFA